MGYGWLKLSLDFATPDIRSIAMRHAKGIRGEGNTKKFWLPEFAIDEIQQLGERQAGCIEIPGNRREQIRRLA